MVNRFRISVATLAAVCLAAVSPAQEPFPDVPADHWAHESLARLKDRVVVGYPDGLYRGARPMTRYEFAVAIHRLWQMIEARTSSLAQTVSDLDARIAGAGGPKPPIPAIPADLTRRISESEAGLAELRRLIDEFRPELASLGVDVGRLKEQTAALDERITALENRRDPIQIGGSADLLVLAGHSSAGLFGLSPTGRATGYGRGSYAGQPVGMTRDLNVFHESVITLSSEPADGPKVNASLVLGNLLGDTQGRNRPGMLNYSDTLSEAYVEELTASFDIGAFGMPTTATLGRFGLELGSYLYRRPDYTPEFSNPRWDDGRHLMDGGRVELDFGNAVLGVFGGRNTARGQNGTLLNEIATETGRIDQTLGADVSFRVSETAKIRAAYLYHDTNDTIFPGGVAANRINVFGGAIEAGFGGFRLDASYARTSFSENTSTSLDTDNTAFDVSLGVRSGALNLSAGYRDIEANFAAAGDWGRLGTFWNPVGVKGWRFGADWKAGSRLTLSGRGEFLDGSQTAGGALLNGDDRLTSLIFGLEYRLRDDVTLKLGYEDVRLDYEMNPPGLGDPTQRWYSLGLDWNLGETSRFGLIYRFSDVDFKGSPEAFRFGDGFADRYKGGLLGTQFSVRF
ncbi:MAG: S-layer homology domain-containing protein [Fimbriimonadaceae bacterium]|nr:S-layer homology domain-containing protein [Fimbriimonadaceae bacterium]